MKLELKHLAGYLPYGLKVLDEKAEPNDNIFTLESISIYDTVTDNEGNIDIPFTEIKPILRPLSDLTKEIEVNGEKFVPSLFLRKHYISESMGINVATYSYRVVNKMLEWHFDIYGLIENNLAIDKNTL